VALMAEPVTIDVLVTLDSRQPQPSAAQTDAARHALESLSETGTRVLTKTDMLTVLTATLQPATTLATSNALVVNAIYGDTGRQLVNAERIELEEHHVVDWRTVTLQLEGV
jgi:hypothetical protein